MIPLLIRLRMLSFDHPRLMIVAFLLLTLATGLYFSRKTNSLQEYAVGNKQFTTATLVATMLATGYGGGSLVRTVEQIHKVGCYYIFLVLICSWLPYWIISRLTLRMAPFMQHLSMPKSIGSIYGKYPRIVSALSGICSCIAFLAIQIHVMSLVLDEYMDLNAPKRITILATLILVCYSTFGGIRSVTWTDVLQFVTFVIIIPLFVYFMFRQTGKPVADIIHFLQTQEKFQVSKMVHSDTKLVAILATILSGTIIYISPPIMQRIYMSSGPIQANRALLYSSFFSFLIMGCIILISLFVFVSAPELAIKEVWPYIMKHSGPAFKGLIAISLLAMAMSTADSCLHACAVMVSHDLVEGMPKIQLPSMRSIRPVRLMVHGMQRLAKIVSPLLLARIATVMVGLFAMLVAFQYKNEGRCLLDLIQLSFACSGPIVAAPFLLAIFGFRGTSRTALIGMATGLFSILAWKQWIYPLEPEIGIDGSFPCMLANGLAMLAAHYLLPQPSGSGWVGPDDELKQIKQARERARQRRHAAIKATFVHKKAFLATCKPNDATLVVGGMYIIISSFMSLGYHWNDSAFHLWPMIPLLLGVGLIGYTTFLHKKSLPDWTVGSYWLLGLCCCLPIHSLYSWWHMPRPFIMLIFSLSHVIVILWGLPLWTGLLVAMPLIIFYPLFCLKVALLWSSSTIFFPLLGLGMVLFVLAIYAKRTITVYEEQVDYLKNQQKIRKELKRKHLAFNLEIHAKTANGDLEEDGVILQKVVKDVTQSISFLDDHPLYKQDFQSIINKFSEWALFLKKQARSKDHILLQPTAITLDELIHQVENALAKEVGRTPRLLIEHQDKTTPSKLICDVNQVIHLLVTAIKPMADLDLVDAKFLRIQFHTTHLQYDQNDATEQFTPLVFPALALVISHSTAHPSTLPKVKNVYKDGTRTTQDDSQHPSYLDFSKKAIERIIRAHYGYVEIPHTSCTMLMVLPWNVATIREEIMAKLPMECLTSEASITAKEEGDSLMGLMDFHAYVSQVAYVDPGVIAEILLLIRRCYGFKRHASGQLFYIRAVGIAQLVATWIFHSPKPIYASLLYDLIRYTRLPFSYIKANYDMGIFCFVENILSVDKRQELEQSLLYIHNRFKDTIRQEQFSVLYIKLAERLYDLRHAAGYKDRKEVKYMAKETFAIDIKLAKQYLEPNIADDLEQAARQALVYCARKR